MFSSMDATLPRKVLQLELQQDNALCWATEAFICCCLLWHGAEAAPWSQASSLQLYWHCYRHLETTGNLKTTVSMEIVHNHQVDIYKSRPHPTCLRETYLTCADFLQCLTLSAKQQAVFQCIPKGLLLTVQPFPFKSFSPYGLLYIQMKI